MSSSTTLFAPTIAQTNPLFFGIPEMKIVVQFASVAAERSCSCLGCCHRAHSIGQESDRNLPKHLAAPGSNSFYCGSVDM